MKFNRPLFLTLFFVLMLSACDYQDALPPKTLQDLTYSERKVESQYTVFIPEDGTPTPYLVLTDTYNGNCLLLRKHVLDTHSIFNTNGPFASYYENSQIDQMLNSDFRSALPDSLDAYIVESEIAITSKDSLNAGQESILLIQREIFLLSSTEVSGLGFRTTADEGITLAYFNSDDRRIAATADGTPSSWWLRTPNMWYDNVVCGVDTTGAVGTGGIGSYADEGEYTNGVRPAFCLPPDTSIREEAGMYYLDLLE